MATRTTNVLAAVAAIASIVLAGCRTNDDQRHQSRSAQLHEEPGDPPSAGAAAGGTLVYYSHFPLVEHLDPQRLYNGRDISNLARTVYRSWVTFPVSADVETATTYVPDLATDTGTSSQGARTWTFTLRDGVTWQDGRPIACADFKYGASRVFATDVITGGPQYLLTYLDIPLDERTGLPIYTGPYHSSATGRAAFDRAITCNGRTITYHFKKPWADFPLAVASLHMMDPYRADKDRGRRSDFQIFSNGPYELEGTWDEEEGGTLVRNPSYDPSTDTTRSRRALPNRIVFDIGKNPEQITDRLIADRGRDRAAVSGESIPRTYFSRITGEVAERAVAVTSPYTWFLVPNFRRLTVLKVRQALAASVDVTAWVEAGGGDKAEKEATDIVHPAMRGYQKGLFPGGSGNPARARQLLESAGVQTPYPITFSYISNGPIADAQAEALKQGWEKAGFKVGLDGRTEKEYYGIVGQPSQKADILWTGWGPDWPSAITVTPPLFDSRPNLTETSNGDDLGRYRSARFEALVDEAQNAPDLDAATTVLQQADQVLADDVAYIPLGIPVFYLLHGSAVTGYVNTAASNWYPDLGAIGVR
ncbi:ABC transporter substrate-binding protein [Nocardioides pocheonensis]|uniref:ABC transporter substrate-binding protein n=1 Tax=Nocardioides pocheonensis TaxID=661485 RepID=A0A3N0GJ02_9ACTN|nr:ABC transporter substrate-binding protein [Nocardioides pocheonensis]RNM12409.1 ABC transporter substrate-binding protein [Nocardioides pocheonensis]